VSILITMLGLLRGRQAAGADGTSRRVPRFPIATKLELSFLLIIILISVIFSAVGLWIIGDRFVAQAQEKVRTDLNSAREIYQNHLSRITDEVLFVSDRDFVRSPASAGGRARLVARLAAIREKEQLDVLSITDAKGAVILRTTNPDLAGDDQSRDPLVRAVLESREPAASTEVVSADELRHESAALAERAGIEIVPTPKARIRTGGRETSGMMLKAAAPIFDFQNHFTGVAYGGRLLNRNYDIVDKIKQTVFQGVRYGGQDIGTATLFQDDVRVSTNVKNADGSRAIGTRLSEEVYDRVVRRGQPWIGRAYVVNNWYITAYEPIRDHAGAIIGVLYVGLLEAKYVDVRRRTMLGFVGVTLVGALTTLTLSHLISQRISGSVKKLMASSEQLARGNLDQRVEIRSGDEFQELAETFNFMAAALKERDRQLKEQAARKVMESERLALIGQLAAGVAHEINNPLTGIVTYSHLLLEQMPRDSRERDSVEKIATQADRCRGIIRGLLDFARQRKPDKRPCNVNTVLQECVALVANQALFHNIEIVTRFGADLPPAPMDPSQMQQVFMNIIINAAEAMTDGGRLELATRVDPAGGSVEVEFVDTGCGIGEADLERIFDPFFTTKDARHGTGLGLAVSYGIVKEHKGTIAVESEVGKGTTFVVRLPLGTQEAA
jgi:two-component system NtrC family sensor kinase